jgi:hypothetical protein
MKKRALIFTFCLLLGITIYILPVYASDEVVISGCTDWKYQYTYYECRNNNTWKVDVYERNCDGRVETKKESSLYLEGICPYIAINPNM